jgi:hypothetical protein
MAAALLAGCGGGSTTIVTQGDTNSTNSLGLSTTMTPRGPSDLVENVTQLADKDYPMLEGLNLDCPDEPTPPNYPVSCTFTAIDTSKLSKRDVPDGEHRPVSGTLNVLGVYPPSRTYAYKVVYGPTNATKSPKK